MKRVTTVPSHYILDEFPKHLTYNMLFYYCCGCCCYTTVTCALILSETLALYKSFTYLLTYLLLLLHMLRQVSCASSTGSMSPSSPRHPTSPTRCTSHTRGASEPANNTAVDNLMRTHNYGSNADELENAGRPVRAAPDTSRNPGAFVGRSPVVKAKRSVDSGEVTRGLNNLNKAENYGGKKSKLLVSLVLILLAELFIKF